MRLFKGKEQEASADSGADVKSALGKEITRLTSELNAGKSRIDSELQAARMEAAKERAALESKLRELKEDVSTLEKRKSELESSASFAELAARLEAVKGKEARMDALLGEAAEAMEEANEAKTVCDEKTRALEEAAAALERAKADGAEFAGKLLLVASVLDGATARRMEAALAIDAAFQRWEKSVAESDGRAAEFLSALEAMRTSLEAREAALASERKKIISQRSSLKAYG